MVFLWIQNPGIFDADLMVRMCQECKDTQAKSVTISVTMLGSWDPLGAMMAMVYQWVYYPLVNIQKTMERSTIF